MNKQRQFRLAGNNSFFLLAGPCVIESEVNVLRHARRLKALTARLRIPFIFKSSYDKANRTSHRSYRGPGAREGLNILGRVREQAGVRVLTDVHSPEEATMAGKVVDMVQIPAFLCRQ